MAVAVLVFMCLLGHPGRLGAYEAAVHYVWTYYLALHTGFTERQAFQIASATISIDYDDDTGPMGAGRATSDKAWGVVLGEDHQMLKNQKALAEMADAKSKLQEQLRRLGINKEMPEMQFWMVGLDVQRFREKQPRIINIWSKFHAFREFALVRDYGAFRNIDDTVFELGRRRHREG